jgi:predicted Zn-dependent protease
MRLSSDALGVVLLSLFLGGCSQGQSGSAASTAASVNSQCNLDKMNLSQSADGDYQSEVFTSPDAPHSNYVLLQGQTSAASAPAWNGAIPWYYNPANAPSAFTPDQVLATIQKGMDTWSSVCGVKWQYMGTTSDTFTVGSMNGISTISWGDADGAAGITENYSEKNSQGFFIFESDMNLSNTQLLDLETLQGVLNHELGHYLGLAHSNVEASIMFANPYHPIPYLLVLQQDDINGCSALYGASSTAVVTTPPTIAGGGTSSIAPASSGCSGSGSSSTPSSANPNSVLVI